MQSNKRDEHPTLSEIPPKKIKPNSIPETPIITLNMEEYRKWNALQVSSILIADDSVGGCNLSGGKVKLLVESDFDGSSLHNIVEDLNRKNVDDTIKELERVYNKQKAPQLSSTCKSVVFWVRDNLIGACTRNVEFTIQLLDKHVGCRLQECFEKRLDSPFDSEPTKIDIGDFYNRDGFSANVESFVHGNVQHFFNNKERPVSRQTDFRFGIIANGTGDGKTRACKEIQNIILGMNLNRAHVTFRKLHCYFPLNNGYRLDKIEIGDESNYLEGKIIGVRLLCSIYGIAMKKMCEISNFKYIYKHTDFFTLRNVVKILSSMLHGEYLLLSIAIDEIQYLMEVLGETVWKQPANSIGEFMVNMTTANHNLNSNVCLIPIISGVATDETMWFNSTEYCNTSFSLPPFSVYDMNLLIPEYLKKWKFKCGKCMTEAFSIEDKTTVYRISVLIIEAMIIPNVLRLTLSGICQSLEKHSFSKWSTASATLYSEIETMVEEKVAEYLPIHRHSNITF